MHDPTNALAQGVTFALVVFGVFMITNALNFSVIALDNRIVENRRLVGQVRELFVPLLPGQIAAGALDGDARRRLHEPRALRRCSARCW